MQRDSPAPALPDGNPVRRMRPMQFPSTGLSKHAVALYVLIAITARSFVAAGWMIQVPHTGLDDTSPILVICPQQSPAIAHWLASEPAAHVHHHVHTDDAPSGASLGTADPGCVLWTGSVFAASPESPKAIAFADDATHNATRVRRLPIAARLSRHQARAPPRLS